MKGLQGLQGCPFEDGDGECPNKLQQTTVGDRLQNLSNLGIKYNLPQIFLELILPRLSLLLPGAPMSRYFYQSFSLDITPGLQVRLQNLSYLGIQSNLQE